MRRSPAGFAAASPATRRDADVVVLPYNPFMWGRWGFAPGLLADVAALRARRRRPRIVLLVHEPYVPIRDAKSLVMGAWQRFQLAALMLLADRRFASIERWASSLGRLRPTAHLPSGSNLPDARSLRAAVRSELVPGGGLVVATLTTGHPSHLAGVRRGGARSGSPATGLPVTFLQLGAGASPVATPAGMRRDPPRDCCLWSGSVRCSPPPTCCSRPTTTVSRRGEVRSWPVSARRSQSSARRGG